jgi:gluconolactonase
MISPPACQLSIPRSPTTLQVRNSQNKGVRHELKNRSKPTVILNNYFGRQFNSLNDVAIHPKNKDIYFTDTIYGYVQDFRPAPGLQDQVYRFNPDTGAVTVVADEFDHPNGRNYFSLIQFYFFEYLLKAGLAFSPDGDYVYITDTGISSGFFGLNFTRPASVYVFCIACSYFGLPLIINSYITATDLM